MTTDSGTEVVPKRKNARRSGGAAQRWWATEGDVARLDRLQKLYASAGLAYPSVALLIRVALIELERRARTKIA